MAEQKFNSTNFVHVLCQLAVNRGFLSNNLEDHEEILSISPQENGDIVFWIGRKGMMFDEQNPKEGEEVRAEVFHWMELMFDHSFAQKLWGDDIAIVAQHEHSVEVSPEPAWQYHLKQLVICNNRFKYMTDNWQTILDNEPEGGEEDGKNRKAKNNPKKTN